MAQERMGDFMTAIVPMAPFEKQADSLAEQHRQARCNVRVNFDTAVFPADDSASRRCEMPLFLNA